jgi:hypothetical protein
MDYLLICATALLVSLVTLYSGFGLGTVLMPAFALFFPVEIAIAATAVVHLSNNLFKMAMVGRHADWGVVARFALPGAVAAMAGAAVLHGFGRMAPLFSYAVASRNMAVLPVKFVIGLLVVLFALVELVPRLRNFTAPRKYLALGGLLSGFFGGLSGNQGALRSAFLTRLGLSKEAFIGTGTVAAVIVDLARLTVYGVQWRAAVPGQVAPLVLAAMGAAFVGSFLGTRLLHKVTLGAIHGLVGALLLVLGIAMATGWV